MKGQRHQIMIINGCSHIVASHFSLSRQFETCLAVAIATCTSGINVSRSIQCCCIACHNTVTDSLTWAMSWSWHCFSKSDTSCWHQCITRVCCCVLHKLTLDFDGCLLILSISLSFLFNNNNWSMLYYYNSTHLLVINYYSTSSTVNKTKQKYLNFLILFILKSFSFLKMYLV